MVKGKLKWVKFNQIMKLDLKMSNIETNQRRKPVSSCEIKINLVQIVFIYEFLSEEKVVLVEKSRTNMKNK